MSVGLLPNNNRRMIRSVPNPMDKSTIVSIYPGTINSVNHTVFPGRFTVNPGTYEKPSILTLGQSSWWRELDDEQPYVEIPVSSISMADSIIKDYCNGLLECNMGDARPGLFFVPGEFTLDQIKKDHKAELDQANIFQQNWFLGLTRLADTLWNQFQGNPRVISDTMKMAAKELNLEDKPWLKDFTMVSMVKCIACGALRNPQYPMCANCKTIVDKDLAKKLALNIA